MVKAALISSKHLIRLIPVFVLLIAMQILLGQLSGYAESDIPAGITIAVSAPAHDAAAREFIEILSRESDLTLIITDASQKNELLLSGTVQVFAEIPEDFPEKLTSGERGIIRLTAAPGQWSIALAKELLGEAIILMRTDVLLGEFSAATGIPRLDTSDLTEASESFLSVTYEGPAMQKNFGIVPPSFGLPSLIWLLPFLHCTAMLPGSDYRRVILRGRKMLLKYEFASLIPVYISWLISLALYIIGLRCIVKADIGFGTILSMAGLITYSLSLGFLFAYFGKRTAAVFIFTAMLFLNMTLGGALWNAETGSIKFPLLLPVTAVLSSGNGSLSGAIVLFIQSAADLAVPVFVGIFSNSNRRKVTVQVG